MTEIKWECNDGTVDEDHDWQFISGDDSVGEGSCMRCKACGKEREATTADYPDDNDWNY